jgi:hypothetical protein
VYITQDRLASFLHTAELLQVRGLTGASNPFKDSVSLSHYVLFSIFEESCDLCMCVCISAVFH